MDRTTEKSSLKKKLFSIFGDNVLIYNVLLIMAVMYHYKSSLTLVFGFIALIMTAIMFKIFDFIAKHKLIGPVIYIVILFLGMFLTKVFIDNGAENYPVDFMVWFLTPQDALEYSSWYTFAMFVLMTGFFTSVVYYFTKVRYRIFMGFLIFIIPFAVYGKEYEKMPVYFIIALAMMYFITMVNYRQMISDGNVKIVDKGEMWKCTLVFALVFGSAAAILPKPTVKEDRTVLETLINADQFTDKLLKTVSVFIDTTSNNNFLSNTSDKVLYYGHADEPLRLKTRSFSTYDFNTDSWNTEYDDTYYPTSEKAVFTKDVTEVYSAVVSAAELDSKFAEKYNLSGLNTENIKYPELKELKLETQNHSSQLLPVPTLYHEVEGSSGKTEIKRTDNDVFFKQNGRFGYTQSFSMTYYSDNFLYSESVKSILDAVSYSDSYSELLNDAYDVLSENGEIEKQAVINKAIGFDDEFFLDYGDSLRIKQLADEITYGLYSDFDKALAIQSYFYNNDFIYDLKYKKDKGDNAETFLFETHRGVCYEYATAMVMLSRAAGIPARYAEGYSMSMETGSDSYGKKIYKIREMDAHGFPELYIGTIGWVSFEPTISDNLTISDDSVQGTATKNLFKSGIVLVILGLIILAAVKIYPSAYQRYFVVKINRSEPDKAALLVMRRICRLYGIGSDKTADEIADKINKKEKIDMHVISDAFNKKVYGDIAVSEKEKQSIVEVYLKIYNAYKEHRKKKR